MMLVVVVVVVVVVVFVVVEDLFAREYNIDVLLAQLQNQLQKTIHSESGIE